MSIKWSDLFAQGTLVDTDISQCRFNRKLNPEDVGMSTTVGLDNNEQNKSKLDFSLIKSNEPELGDIASSINKVKKLVDANSLSFPLVEGARYIPKTRVATVLATLKEIKDEFNESVSKLADKYTTIRDKNINRLRGEIAEYTKGKDESLTLTETALQKLLASFPTADDIRHKFNITWKAFSIAAPVDQQTAEAVEEETQSVKDVVKEMVRNLRQDLIDRVNAVLSLASKNADFETLHGKTREAVEDTCKRIKELNILGDSELNTAIGRLETIIQSDNSKEVLANLTDLKVSLEGSLEGAVKTVTDKLTSVGKRNLDL